MILSPSKINQRQVTPARHNRRGGEHCTFQCYGNHPFKKSLGKEWWKKCVSFRCESRNLDILESCKIILSYLQRMKRVWYMLLWDENMGHHCPRTESLNCSTLFASATAQANAQTQSKKDWEKQDRSVGVRRHRWVSSGCILDPHVLFLCIFYRFCIWHSHYQCHLILCFWHLIKQCLSFCLYLSSRHPTLQTSSWKKAIVGCVYLPVWACTRQRVAFLANSDMLRNLCTDPLWEGIISSVLKCVMVKQNDLQ